MKARGWLGYLVGGLLFSNGLPGAGIAVFSVGMLVDWRYWIFGILAFFVGVNWR